MFISKVTLVNYRNFKREKFIFNSGVNTIIGENGSGKTNLFRAIRLLLDDTSIQYAYKLDENDFNRTLTNPLGHWIIISIEFSDISDDEAIQSLFAHGTGVIKDNSKVKTSSYNLFFRPKADIRFKLSELKEGDHKGLKSILSNISFRDDYETIFTGKSSVDFADKQSYINLVGDFEKVKFNYEVDSSLYGIKIPHQLSVSKEISFTYIQALRDVVSDFHNNRTNPLLTLLKNKSGDIEKTDYEAIILLVNELNDNIEKLPDIQKIRDDIKLTMNEVVGETYSPSSLMIQSSLTAESNKLLQSLRLFISECGETYEGAVHELSLGAANLVFITLKILEYKYQTEKESFANFLMIEEPEAHLHTHIQKTLFDKISFSNTQIIYSTHSTHISDASNVSNMNILTKKYNYAEVFQPGNGLNSGSINQIQRYLDAIRCNLLFAKSVLLVEGDAEEILLPIMVKEVLGVSLDELGISLINIRSTGFKNVAQLFHNDRIRRKCCIITDLDDAICNTKILASDTDSIKKYKQKVENSKRKGLERKDLLDEYVKDNQWLTVSYADYTFEVDFIANNNSYEVEQIVEKVYSDKVTIKQAKKDLNSDDVAIFGKRILTMAKQEGKGWFAIMLGEEVFYETNIPNYIYDAISFILSDISKELISSIISYRVNKFSDDPEDKNDYTDIRLSISKFDDGKIDLTDLIIELEREIADDQIIYFLKSV